MEHSINLENTLSFPYVSGKVAYYIAYYCKKCCRRCVYIHNMISIFLLIIYYCGMKNNAFVGKILLHVKKYKISNIRATARKDPWIRQLDVCALARNINLKHVSATREIDKKNCKFLGTNPNLQNYEKSRNSLTLLKELHNNIFIVFKHQYIFLSIGRMIF